VGFDDVDLVVVIARLLDHGQAERVDRGVVSDEVDLPFVPCDGAADDEGAGHGFEPGRIFGALFHVGHKVIGVCFSERVHVQLTQTLADRSVELCHDVVDGVGLGEGEGGLLAVPLDEGDRLRRFEDEVSAGIPEAVNVVELRVSSGKVSDFTDGFFEITPVHHEQVLLAPALIVGEGNTPRAFVHRDGHVTGTDGGEGFQCGLHLCGRRVVGDLICCGFGIVGGECQGGGSAPSGDGHSGGADGLVEADAEVPLRGSLDGHISGADGTQAFESRLYLRSGCRMRESAGGRRSDGQREGARGGADRQVLDFGDPVGDREGSARGSRH